MNKYLFIPILIATTACANLPDAKEGQKIENTFVKLPEEITEGNGPVKNKGSYIQDSHEVNTESVIELLSKTESSKPAFKKAQRLYLVNKTFMYSSSLLFAYALTQSNEARLNSAVSSFILMMFGSVARRFAAEGLDSAVDIYNQELPTKPNEKTHFDLLPSSQNVNLGLVLNYKF